ncbi:hypothetical protein AB0N17_03210 [Streptomyces sp. NPDC051133]|uniref:hypothetical protein n=1 Tax=Streptomyces sp. NPDC051133 TaxID=3155521 RepID=UPI0034132B51
MTEQIEDDFWAEERARAAAERGQQADPSACGTCRGRVAAGGQVEHEECAQRATLLQAPDHPYYELITGMSEEEVWALPARFHVPVFLDSCTPKAWVCAVCWGDGWNTQWPCKTAQDHGAAVFTPAHQAETAAKKQAAELAAYRALELGDLDGRMSASCGNPDHPAWLRAPDDTRGCPWCRIAELTAPAQDGVTAEQALITYATSTRTVTADGLVPYLTAVKAEAMFAEWERHRSMREERKRLRAEVKQWRATYGRDALPGTRAQMEHLRARITELVAELAAAEERYAAGLRRADEDVNAMSEELKRYAAGEERPVLWSVYNAMHNRAATAEARVAELERERAKYVGKEPTIAEEMAYLSRCIDSILDLCTKAEEQAGRWEQPLPVPEWVAEVRKAAEGLIERQTYPPALPWARLMDTEDLTDFLRDLDAGMRDAARQAHFAGRPQAPAVLAALEQACSTWRAIAEAQHAHNTAIGPEAGETR